MNNLLPHAVSRLARASVQVAELAQLSPAARVRAERIATRPQGPTGFAEKITDDQFVELVRSFGRPASFTEIVRAAEEKHFVTEATVHRRLKKMIQVGRISRQTGELGHRLYVVGRPAPKKSVRVTVPVEMTQQQHRELSLLAAAYGAPIADTLFVLALMRYTTVCQATIDWDDELELFDDCHDHHVKKRNALLANFRDLSDDDTTQRISLLERYSRVVEQN